MFTDVSSEPAVSIFMVEVMLRRMEGASPKHWYIPLVGRNTF